MLIISSCLQQNAIIIADARNVSGFSLLRDKEVSVKLSVKILQANISKSLHTFHFRIIISYIILKKCLIREMNSISNLKPLQYLRIIYNNNFHIWNVTDQINIHYKSLICMSMLHVLPWWQQLYFFCPEMIKVPNM